MLHNICERQILFYEGCKYGTICFSCTSAISEETAYIPVTLITGHIMLYTPSLTNVNRLNSVIYIIHVSTCCSESLSFTISNNNRMHKLNTVNTELGYGLNDQGFASSRKNFLSITKCRPVFRSTRPPIQWLLTSI